MNKLGIQIILGLILMLSMSCSSTNKTIWIAPYTQPCTAGVMKKDCMLVKWEENQQDWEYFYNEIEGFDYEANFLYEIEVLVEEVPNPPMDASSLKYSLEKLVSKQAQKKFSVEEIIEFLKAEDLILKPRGHSDEEIANTPSYQPKLVEETKYSYTIVSETYEPVTYEGDCANTNGCTPVRKRFIEVNAYTKEIIEKREDLELVPNYE